MGDDRSARLLGELEQLREQAERLSARLTAGLGSNGRYDGEDPDGLALVQVDGLGRVADVRVLSGWRRVTDVAGLQRAVVSAVTAAGTRRLQAWGEAVAPTTTGGQNRAGDAASPSAALLPLPPNGGSWLDEASGDSLVRAVLPLLESAEQQIDEVRERAETRFAGEAVVAHPDGGVRARVRGGVVSEVEFDTGWVAAASGGEIARRLRNVLQTAYDRTWAETDVGLPEELAALSALAADPLGMLRRLGLNG